MDLKKLLKLFKPEIFEDVNGVIGTGDTEEDYQLCSGILDLPKARNDFWKFQYQVHQPDIAKNTCTLASTIGAFQDLIGQELSAAQKQDILAEAKLLGFSDDKGWYVQSAVDLIQTWGSKFLGQDIAYYRVSIGSDEYWDVLNKGYSVMTSFRGNSAYTKDKDADGDIDGTSFSPSTYGHAIRHVIAKDGIDIVDNYPKTAKFNVYSVPKPVLEGLLKNGVFGEFGYVYAYKADVITSDSELWNRIPDYAKKDYEKAIKKGVILDISNPLKIVGTKELEDMYIKLGIFTKSEGNVTEARQIVALGRMNKLD